MVLNKDFREFIALLNKNKVKYLIVGGYAVAFHGHPRYTKDIDIWLWIDKSNAENIINALHEFGFNLPGLTQEDFLKKGNVIQLGYPPNRIDLLTEVSGLDFTTVYPDKIEVVIDKVTLNFIDIENLKTNKKASGRYQDLADLENLT
jgi:hypothetical protein